MFETDKVNYKTGFFEVMDLLYNSASVQRHEVSEATSNFYWSHISRDHDGFGSDEGSDDGLVNSHGVICKTCNERIGIAFGDTESHIKNELCSDCITG